MKKYSMHASGQDTDWNMRMVENDDGEWVTRRDAEKGKGEVYNRGYFAGAKVYSEAYKAGYVEAENRKPTKEEADPLNNGKWVKREDAEREASEAYNQGLNYRTIGLPDNVNMSPSNEESYHKGYQAARAHYEARKPKEFPECICQEIVSRIPPESKYPDFWICPAHGYKRR